MTLLNCLCSVRVPTTNDTNTDKSSNTIKTLISKSSIGRRYSVFRILTSSTEKQRELRRQSTLREKMRKVNHSLVKSGNKENSLGKKQAGLEQQAQTAFILSWNMFTLITNETCFTVKIVHIRRCIAWIMVETCLFWSWLKLPQKVVSIMLPWQNKHVKHFRRKRRKSEYPKRDSSAEGMQQQVMTQVLRRTSSLSESGWELRVTGRFRVLLIALQRTLTKKRWGSLSTTCVRLEKWKCGGSRWSLQNFAKYTNFCYDKLTFINSFHSRVSTSGKEGTFRYIWY